MEEEVGECTLSRGLALYIDGSTLHIKIQNL